jgi:hypothetical protein
LLDDAGPCSLNGTSSLPANYDAWRYTLEKTVRKELERSWRVFTAMPPQPSGSPRIMMRR